MKFCGRCSKQTEFRSDNMDVYELVEWFGGSIAERKNPINPRLADYSLDRCKECKTFWESRPDDVGFDRFHSGPTTSYRVSEDYVRTNYPNLKLS